jgi:NAD+ synthase
MDFKGDENALTGREKEVLVIYRRFNTVNRHKMEAIPVCEIPTNLKK